jgi:hypothetical protein
MRVNHAGPQPRRSRIVFGANRRRNRDMAIDVSSVLDSSRNCSCDSKPRSRGRRKTVPTSFFWLQLFGQSQKGVSSTRILFGSVRLLSANTLDMPTVCRHDHMLGVSATRLWTTNLPKNTGSGSPLILRAIPKSSFSIFTRSRCMSTRTTLAALPKPSQKRPPCLPGYLTIRRGSPEGFLGSQ